MIYQLSSANIRPLMTHESIFEPKQAEDSQEKEDRDFAAIIKKTISYLGVLKPGTTLGDLRVTPTQVQKVTTEEMGAKSTVQEDNKLFEQGAEGRKKHKEDKMEQKRTGKHPR